MTEAVITGLGPVAPNGLGKDQFWEALRTGKSGIRRIFGDNGSAPNIAGQVPRSWIVGENSHSDSNGTAWRTRMIVTAARLALQDAGLDQMAFSSYRSGIRIGVSNIDMEVTEREFEVFRATGAVSPTAVVEVFPHAAASEIARELSCSGSVLTFAAACTSGLLSIISAVDSILRGESDIELAGGGDSSLTPFFVNSFKTAGFLSTQYIDNPPAASRPFDAQRDCGVLSEGAGAIVLENVEHARRRGAKVYARVTGWGIANATSPKSLKRAFVSAMEQALDKAGLPPNMVDYVSAHAPGVQWTDKMEVQAIKEVFGPQAYNLAVSSIKSMIGNPLAASGPLQVIAVAQTMEHKYIPPTTNYQHPDPHCDLDFVPNLGRVARVDTALVNSGGIGGCIASLVIEKPLGESR